MEYRYLPNSSCRVSTIGIGAGSLRESGPEEIRKIINSGMEHGINLIDTVMSDTSAAEPIAQALKGRRDEMIMQIHLGAVYPHETYSRTRSLSELQRGFEGELKKYGTDYADIGLIHYVDEVSDFEEILSGGIFDYALKLKDEGVIRHLGFSSHSAEVSRLFIETGEIDVFMFSLNAAYDFEPSEGKLILAKERAELYRACEKRGVGITVMKPYCGGQLLNAKTSPLYHRMSIPQCIRYALDSPVVISCLPGVRSLKDLEDVLGYYSASEEECDYSFIGSLPHRDINGICIYCGHCQPCPAGIDIASLNKYLDLAKSGDELARDHYMKLDKNAEDCTGCGVCEKNCPFHVDILERIQEACELFPPVTIGKP
ncbi:aldo/keto reductase [Methanogenium organophilum]|uniref:Aldo/keto reductase n=1 Tax=Methanogenium organophilum TaxID=2199 RepID=A0A9X9T8C3_METOG|nr:aldo/keto reductase [Methanogenium organophilum]WAI01555.1 aldo/keto reductase [Methanogenium organophilum]